MFLEKSLVYFNIYFNCKWVKLPTISVFKYGYVDFKSIVSSQELIFYTFKYSMTNIEVFKQEKTCSFVFVFTCYIQSYFHVR